MEKNYHFVYQKTVTGRITVPARDGNHAEDRARQFIEEGNGVDDKTEITMLDLESSDADDHA